MTESAHGGDWNEYYEKTTGRPPRKTLLAALAAFSDDGAGRSAVDLGCGDGRDTIELLRRGWRVIAIDAEPQAIERLETRRDLPRRGALTAICARFEIARWPKVDLVNASFALPLCPPAQFPALWARIDRSLKLGGRFAGQLFGERDSWHGAAGIVTHDRATVERLLADVTVEMLDEEETDVVTPYGKAKHWHIFHIVARKP
jgi:tellurite methyltransferase